MGLLGMTVVSGGSVASAALEPELAQARAGLRAVTCTCQKLRSSSLSRCNLRLKEVLQHACIAKILIKTSSKACPSRRGRALHTVVMQHSDQVDQDEISPLFAIYCRR